jgi:AcrR family transcriptional regulator
MQSITGRQRQIVDAALDIVAERGPEAVTVKGIAERVGFSDAAVYRHFRSKSQILGLVVDLFADGSRRSLEEIQACPCPAMEKLRLFFLDRCRVFAADRVTATVMFAEGLFQSDPGMAERIHQVLQEHRALLLQTIRDGQRRGTIRPLNAEHLFTTVMGALRLLVLQWRVGGGAFDLPRAGERLWSTLAALIAVPDPHKET